MFSSYAKEWRQLLQGFDAETRKVLAVIAHAHHSALAQHFYSVMLKDEAASSLLSHEQVQTQLLASMQRWVVQVLATADDADFDALVARQVHIGQVHARIDVPVHLVLRGARCLKNGVHALLANYAPQVQARVMRMATNVMDQAMEVMSQGYAVSKDDDARSKEAYRLLTGVQHASAVREQRRAELLEWENQCLYLHATGRAHLPVSSLSSSDFGVWFRHKGMDSFQGQPTAHHIAQTMQRIDQQHLPALVQATAGEVASALVKLREEVRDIALSLDALFRQSSDAEAGRDGLTQLFNRKFLPVILAKEVQYARKSGSAFSVLVIDIDHFKQINAVLGRDGGDAVLQQIAGALTQNIRGGDYAFRLGGEEFLMVLVDTAGPAAVQLAEKLRVQIARQAWTQHSQNVGACRVTVSVGVATFDGHPDYQRILQRSDEALDRAKAAGRNCVVSAEDTRAERHSPPVM